MTNAAETAYHSDEDEEGVAAGAASLGPDGGPTAASLNAVAQPSAGQAEDLTEDDESWLDEELSDEELAALGEEDFDEEIFLSEETASEAAAEEEFYEDDIDASFDPVEELEANDADYTDAPDDQSSGANIAANYDAADLDEDDFAENDGATEAAVESAGALVTAGAGASIIENGGYGGEITDLGEEEVDHRPVPRISIHAFCETPATTALLEKAAVDRRLSKTHLTIHMGGVAKAIDQFQTAATPNLIILETMADGSEIFAQLAELAEVCDPSSKVVIIGQVNDIILYRELIRQGISEYIVRPHSPLQIIKTIADLYVDPAAPPIGKTIAFVGARGGVGSSTIAHNVGWCAAEEYKTSTVILDLDLPFGTASLDFDQEASAGLYEALTSPERLDDVLLDRLLQKHTDYLSLFTAPSMLDRDFDLDEQAFETVIDVVRNAAPTVVVDVPHIWTNWSKRILMGADEIVITATPDLASFRNTKNLIDILNSARPNDSSPRLLLNQFDPKTSAVQPDQFAEHVGIEPAQVIAWEPQLFGAAATNAAPIMEVGPKTKTALGLQELSADLIGRTEAGIARPKFSLAGLFKKRK